MRQPLRRRWLPFATAASFQSASFSTWAPWNRARICRFFCAPTPPGDNKQTTPIPLILAGGKGWFYDEIFRLVQELALEQYVHFPGFIPQSEVADWYRAASVFVYPSRFEGFGLPVLEAMASGTPVLCSDTPSLLEVAGDATLIFPSDERAGVPVLTAQLNQVLDDADVHGQMHVAGLARARQFSWARTAQATLAVYDEILG